MSDVLDRPVAIAAQSGLPGADEILTAFVELERAIHEFAVSSIS